MNAPDFERRIQQCWDERRDPADDAEVQAHLLAHPELLEDFARWRTSVHAVSASTEPSVRRPMPWRVMAAAAIVIVSAGWWWSSSSTAEAAGAGHVVSSTFETATGGPRATVAWREQRVLVATPDTTFTITEHRSAIR